MTGGYGLSNSSFMDKNNIWFGAYRNVIYYSTTNGNNWLSQTTDDDVNSSVSAIGFNSSNVGISGASNGSVFKTTNRNTWNNITVPGTAYVKGIISIDNSWWIIRDDKYIYNSNDNGTNWNTEYTSASGKYTSITKSRNGSMLWAIKDNGSISKMDFTTGIDPNINEIPNSIILEQNYPNPFNPETQIKFSLSKQSKISLKIFDVTGREVSTLINSVSYTAGNFTQIFDGSGLQSGIYFYSLYIDGVSLYTKKMILVK